MALIWCVLLAFILYITNASESHPCQRPCKVDQIPKTCEYIFSVEWYLTLSKACWNCPFITEDCFRAHCVSGDGKMRPIMVVNRQMPGPSIEVCEGDSVVVWVTNHLSDGSTTSIHWHGIHQHMTPYMDGLPHITQCPILPLETFRYEFVASPAGTHWYHSHTGTQRGDGLYGPFIVRQPPELEPGLSLYDFDLSEHVMLIADWMSDTSHNGYLELMHDAYQMHPLSALINGRNRLYEVPNTFNASGSPLISAKTPTSTFRIERGLGRYRFRLISVAQKCAFRVFFQQHAMQIIASDGMPVSPVTVDSVMVGPGERFDVVINANQKSGSYWIKAFGLRDCWHSNATAIAVLRYDGAEEDYPTGNPYTYDLGTLFGPLVNRLKTPAYYGDGRPTITLTELNSTKQVNLTEHPPDVIHYISMTFLNNDNSVFNDKDLYPVKSLPAYKYHITPVMNNITFRMPPVPLLTQPQDVDEADWFCNRSTIPDMDQCQSNLCQCTHRLYVQYNQMVEIILVGLDEEGVGHPMHLHGYSFYVLAMEPLDPPFTLEHVEEMDRQGLLPRKLINPPLKDTLNMPNKHYAIVRFKADNPGFWFFHCHIDSHLAQGKAFILQVGDYLDFPPLPDGLPRCGGYGTNAKRLKEQTHCENKSNSAPTQCLSCTLCLVCLILVLFDKE